MIRRASKRIEYLEVKVNDLQYQIDCLSQMLGYLRTENDFVDFKYKGNDIEDMLSNGDTGYYEPEEDEKEEPYP